MVNVNHSDKILLISICIKIKIDNKEIKCDIL